MALTALDRALDGLPRRRVLVVSDRYPPDVGGGAERSLHLMLREPALRDQALVVAFDKTLAEPVRRVVDGVETIALPAPAAFPLDRLSQADVDKLKMRPFGLKWPAFAAAALKGPSLGFGERFSALTLHMAARPSGGVAMDHATVPGGAMETALRRIIDHVGPELVHADNARAIMVAAGALDGRQIPLVAAVRDHRFTRSRFDQGVDSLGLDGGGWGDRAAARFAARALAFRQERLAKADVVLVASAHLANEVTALSPASRVLRLPLTPVAPLLVTPPPTTGFNVLIVGSLNPNKGQERFLELWPAVLNLFPQATLDVAGDGPSMGAIRARIATLGVDDSVRLHGRVEDDALAAFYAGCHVVALPTLWAEPFGRVPLEAGAAGRPVIAYAVGGHAETVIDGVTGRLVAPADETGFVAALAALARDETVRKRLGEANRRQAAAFAPAELADGLVRAWEMALDGPASALPV